MAPRNRRKAKKAQQGKGRFFSKSVGPSEHKWTSTGTIRGAECEFCGRVFPPLSEQSGESYDIGWLLGRQYVGECCGKFIDNLYAELGQLFAMRFLEEFAESPLDPEFGFLRFILPERLEAVRQKSEAMAAEAKKLQGQLVAVH